MTVQTKTNTPAKIYGDAGLIYIRYDAKIETKPSGQQKDRGKPTGIQQYHEADS